MNILLTGATGFIGSAFTREAIRRGHKVAGMALPSERLPTGLETAPGVVWIRGTLDQPAWAEICSFAPDVCVHAAWITTPGVYLESPANYEFLETSKAFLSRAVREGIRHIVALGTCIEYKITTTPLSESTSTIAPTTPYARCKNELRLWLDSEAQRCSVSTCWARVFYPYGPGEHPSRLCSSIVSQLRNGQEVFIKTPNSTKDYIFIDDLARALLKVVESKIMGPVNIGTGVGVTVREVAQIISKLLDRVDLVKYGDGVDPLGFVVADVERLRGLGWAPEYDMARGIKTLMSNLSNRAV